MWICHLAFFRKRSCLKSKIDLFIIENEESFKFAAIYTDTVIID